MYFQLDRWLTGKKLTDDLDFRHYNTGISNSFTNWAYVKKAYAQANLASDYTTSDMPMCSYNSIALQQMLNQLKTIDKQIGVMHPVLLQLLSYDRSNDTEYYQTLKTFILQERNMSKSARILNIHLNTMKYRMQRITEITGIDLEDQDVRIHLLLSFLI